MSIIFYSKWDDAIAWEQHLRQNLPGADILVWPDILDAAKQDVDIAIVWKPYKGFFQEYPNLKIIFSLGAGVDHIFKHKSLVPPIPIVRLVDPFLTEGMSEYIIYMVLKYHRFFHEYGEDLKTKTWRRLPQYAAREQRIGILGSGVLGQDAAIKLLNLGFQVATYSRSKKPGLDARITQYEQKDLSIFLQSATIFVNLLPLTTETENFFHKDIFSQMPQGSYFINVARGAHVVDQDLLAALETGHLAHATLDVFRQEPLDEVHPFWNHPKIDMTPHIASISMAPTGAAIIASNIKKYQQGEQILHTINPDTGY